MSKAIASSLKERANTAFNQGNYDKYMITYETLYDQDLITIQELQSAKNLYKSNMDLQYEKEHTSRLERLMMGRPDPSELGGGLTLRPSQQSRLYKPIDPLTAIKGKAFKKPQEQTTAEKEEYEKSMKMLRQFNRMDFIITSGDDMTDVLNARNKLVSEQLVNPANRTLKKFDQVLSERLGNKYITDMFNENEKNMISTLQENYNQIVEEAPDKKYYTAQSSAQAKLGLEDEVLGAEEAMDEAIRNTHRGQNPVMTNATEIEYEPPVERTEKTVLSLDNLFRTRNIDATPIVSEEMNYNIIDNEDPLPLTINDNLIVSSMEDVESYGRDQTKTENHTEYSGLELSQLQILKNEIASMEFQSLEVQRDLLRELTQEIEVLSGGMRDSLFNANDLMTAKDNNLSPDIDYSSDGSALSALDRGRNAQHLVNVDLDGIDNFFNNVDENPNQADKIGQGANFIGANIFRNTYGSNPVVSDPSQAGDIMSNINNRINLGDDWFSRSGKREKGFITEESPSLSSRFENVNAVTLNKDFKGLGKWNPYIGNRNDLMLGQYRQNLGTSQLSGLDGERIRQEKRGEMMAQQQSRMASALPNQQQSALPMPQGVAPPSISAIRQQGDDYNKPTRSLRGDAINLIRLSNKKALELANEFVA